MSTTPEPTTPDAGQRIPHRVVEAVATVPWAITEEALDTIVAIATRQNEVSPEALEAYRGRAAAGLELVTMRGTVAVLNITGPMFRRADMFTMFSGACDYESIAREFTALLENASVSAILLNIDSPGGEVNGCAELGAMIRAGAARKPVETYVGGQACSAAYWLGCAGSRMTISETAVLGSIGVRMGITDTTERDAKRGVKTIEFVSSNAPNKKLDWGSDTGRARIQKTADQLEAVFLANVASNRGITVDEVVAKFGAGGVEVGNDAVVLGMADAIGSFEAVVSRLGAGNGVTVSSNRKVHTAMEKTHTQAEVDTAAATAATNAQTRIAAILDSDAGKKRPTLARHLAFKTSMSADDANSTLAASAEEVTTAAAPETTTTAAAPAAPAAPAPAAPAPTAPRASQADGGLAFDAATGGSKPDTEKKATGPDSSSIYKARAAKMNQSA